VTLKNAWKVVNYVQNHYFLFFTRTAEEKRRWLEAFVQERLQIRRDYENGVQFTDKDREAAHRAVLANRSGSGHNKPKNKPKGE
jgi:hypothetical protein